jgi:hypothetical protein
VCGTLLVIGYENSTMTIILEESTKLDFHTDLKAIVDPFKDEFKAMNWLVTAIDYLELDNKGKEVELNNGTYAVEYSGQELMDMLTEHNLQFSWGIFAGFNKSIPKIIEPELLFVDCNELIWTEPEKYLIPTADIEIICWDNSATILKFKDNQLAERFIEYFTESKIMKPVR